MCDKMSDEEILEEFLEIEEGDEVIVRYAGVRKMQTEAEIVNGGNEDKVVSFLIPQTEPKLVFVNGKVRLETRPLGKSREWSQYASINSIEIV